VNNGADEQGFWHPEKSLLAVQIFHLSTTEP
jgi:hypothetical protein